MYGYVVPDKERLAKEEFVLYNAFYCGLCKELGRSYGQLPRYTTNYDITFFAALLHDLCGQSVEFTDERCVGNPFRKKHLICGNPLLKRIADLNIIFSYYKLQDDIADGDKSKALASRALKKPFALAAASEPKLEQTVREGYAALAALEKANTAGIDRVADCFSNLLMQSARILIGDSMDNIANNSNVADSSRVASTDDALKLVYNIGKFVYLADALDDVGEDYKKKRYNPFLAVFNDYSGRVKFISDHKTQLTFVFATTVNRAIECFNGIEFTQSYPMLKNIVYYGLRKKTDELFASVKKLKKPKL